MTEHQRHDAWNRFIQDLESSRLDQAYQHHPDRARLRRYIEGGASDAADAVEFAPTPDGDLQSWLEGASGWSAPAISLHVLTCSICRRRIELIREEQLTPAEDPSPTPWWQVALDKLGGVVTSPRVRWAATACAIGIFLISLTLSLLPSDLPGGDDPPPLPVERHEPRGGGIG